MMEPLYHFIRLHTASLYTVVYSGPAFFLDYWSLVHLGSGFALMAIALRLRIRHRWLVIAAILVAYEVLEVAFIYFSVHLFLPETFPDQGTDIVVGMAGALAASGVARFGARTGLRRPPRPGEAVVALALAFLVSLAWVRYYGYRYNLPALNSGTVNWWALTLWTFGLFVVQRTWVRLRRNGLPVPTCIGIVAVGYWIGLLALEYVGYRLLGIRESRGFPPLAFGLVHGTATLKVYYACAGLLFVSLASAVGRVRGVAPASRA